VSGRGIGMLRENGIEVITGVLADEARPGLAGFLTRIVKKRPYVILKLALSADGKIAAGPGERTTITGQPFWQRVHLLRAESDAIMVGAQTVRIDDPSLTCRLPGLEDRSPVRIVAGAAPENSRLAQTADKIPVWQLAPSEAQNVHTLNVRTGPEGRIDLASALAAIAQKGINQLLVEGGAQLARSLLEADLADEVWLAAAPHELGPGGVDALAGLPLSFVTGDDERFILCRKEAIGADTLNVYLRKKP
ncbi:MAG TPA: bifunctional diaminohydroxyphosphoribosylaminopyrimidine deaminase/5-amino-6-(5-phosphoribosylamino)uracil reductase, partial [Rhizobiales bacterium]|nr:bifunctional diaminohydroxyphosphoribosylaminopyrimidine deaminase/5-amino-6-(5-phosphoribosylamino)uracil reductase [Hyphomicrobiales bacterium]